MCQITDESDSFLAVLAVHPWSTLLEHQPNSERHTLRAYIPDENCCQTETARRPNQIRDVLEFRSQDAPSNFSVSPLVFPLS